MPASTHSPTVSASTIDAWADETDVIVVGGGASGFTAGIMAAEGGARVVLLEKAHAIGGTSAKSGAGMWVPAKVHERRCGSELRHEAPTVRVVHVGDHHAAALADDRARMGFPHPACPARDERDLVRESAGHCARAVIRSRGIRSDPARDAHARRARRQRG